MKVTTRRGDQGMTDLYGGKRVPKSDLHIELIGQCDELQSLLGIVKNLSPVEAEKKDITRLQEMLYRIMGAIAGAPSQLDIASWVREIEANEQKLLTHTDIPSKFVIPGETLIEAWYQFARTRIRSFERTLVVSAKKHTAFERFIPFFNRLSDYFFILAQAHGLSQNDAKV